MPEAWETYYLMVGSSAGALIGLLFVVITLTGEVEPAKMASAQRTFLTPTVFHFVAVLIISCTAVVVTLPAPAMALVTFLPAAVGFAYAVAAIIRLVTGRTTAPHWTDYIFYGVLPAIGYLWLLIAAWTIWRRAEFAEYGLAIGTMALLLLGIRDAWDLATWLVYNKKG